MDDGFAEAIGRLQTEIQERQEELELLRRARGPEPVEDHLLQGPEGPLRLSALFGDHDDLLLIHNMGRRCPYCTMWADGFQGLLRHLQERAAIVLCSPDAPPEQAAFAASRGWTLPMVSDPSGEVTTALGFREVKDGRTMLTPGVSAFHRSPSGEIHRVTSDTFGPGDAYNAGWHLMGLLQDGVGPWRPTLDAGPPEAAPSEAV